MERVKHQCPQYLSTRVIILLLDGNHETVPAECWATENNMAIYIFSAIESVLVSVNLVSYAVGQSISASGLDILILSARWASTPIAELHLPWLQVERTVFQYMTAVTMVKSFGHLKACLITNMRVDTPANVN